MILCFKCPDVVNYAIDNYIANQRDIFIVNGGDEGDFEGESLVDKIRSKIDKWVKWGEVISIEIDLDNDTARAIKNE